MSIHELHFAPREWVESSREIPDDIDPVEADRFMNKLKMDQLSQGSGMFDSFVFAAQHTVELQAWIEETLKAAAHHKQIVTHKDLEALQPCPGFAPLRVIRNTLECTTQWVLEQLRTPLH